MMPGLPPAVGPAAHAMAAADAAHTGGELATVPLIFSGNRLELNVDTAVAGSAQVELLGPEGRPAHGFGLPQATVIRGNYVAYTVEWQGRQDVGLLAGTPVRIRFVLRDAKLYVFQFPG